MEISQSSAESALPGPSETSEKALTSSPQQDLSNPAQPLTNNKRACSEPLHSEEGYDSDKKAISKPKMKQRGIKAWGHWSTEECQAFKAALFEHGEDWKKIQQRVGTRTRTQVMSHVQKHFNKVKRDQVKQWKAEEKKKEAEATPTSSGEPTPSPLPNKIFNIVRHYRPINGRRIKASYELDYETFLVPRSQIKKKSTKTSDFVLTPRPVQVPPSVSTPHVAPPTPPAESASSADEEFKYESPLSFLDATSGQSAEEGSEDAQREEEAAERRWKKHFTALFAPEP